MSDWTSEFEHFFTPHGSEYIELQRKKKALAVINKKFNQFYNYNKATESITLTQKAVTFDNITTIYYYNTLFE